MKTYRHSDAPLALFGVPFFHQTGRLERLPAQLREQLPRLEFLGRRIPGARLCFRTDAPTFTVDIRFKTLSVDIGMSIFSCQSAAVMIGDRQNARFAGIVNPLNYEQKAFQRSFAKDPVMEDVTIWLPRNEEIDEVTVSFPDGAAVEAPTPYRYGKAVFYGSSITEGGIACGMQNNYVALLSRWLDLDFYNLGFSGSALGETAMADYINTLDMTLFVMDYDHNAPDARHLQQTHEPFFKRIRQQHPDLPILLLTCPNFDHMPQAALRRDIVRTTYQNALAAGDKNVWFADGESFFADADRQLCTIDTIHPNDLGFYRMARALLPTLQQMLAK